MPKSVMSLPRGALCEFWLSNGTQCGERAEYAYPAASDDYMTLCADHAQRHLADCLVLSTASEEIDLRLCMTEEKADVYSACVEYGNVRSVYGNPEAAVRALEDAVEHLVQTVWNAAVNACAKAVYDDSVCSTEVAYNNGIFDALAAIRRVGEVGNA